MTRDEEIAAKAAELELSVARWAREEKLLDYDERIRVTLTIERAPEVAQNPPSPPAWKFFTDKLVTGIGANNRTHAAHEVITSLHKDVSMLSIQEFVRKYPTKRLLRQAIEEAHVSVGGKVMDILAEAIREADLPFPNK